MKFKISTAHSTTEDMSRYIPESHYITKLNMVGVHLLDEYTENYDCEGNFLPEDLEKNNNKVYIPYIGIDKIELMNLSYSKEEYYIAENETVNYLGVFLTEQKAQNVQEIMDLISNLAKKIKTYGFNSNEVKAYSKEIQDDVNSLGGNWIQDQNSIIGITFLDENDQIVYIDNNINILENINENKIYTDNITPIPKIKHKKTI